MMVFAKPLSLVFIYGGFIIGAAVSGLDSNWIPLLSLVTVVCSFLWTIYTSRQNAQRGDIQVLQGQMDGLDKENDRLREDKKDLQDELARTRTNLRDAREEARLFAQKLAMK